jgi:GNAT superfamily N-acetyltransferase
MPLFIRDAREDDAAEIARLTLQLGYSRPAASIAASLSRIMTRPAQQILIAEQEGQVVGWVHAALADFVDVDPYVLVAGLVVDAGARRSGAGRLLMAAVEDWARAQGVGTVRLTSSSTRVGAHRFYERIGYTNIKTQYSFAKRLTDDAGSLSDFVPVVD